MRDTEELTSNSRLSTEPLSALSLSLSSPAQEDTPGHEGSNHATCGLRAIVNFNICSSALVASVNFNVGGADCPARGGNRNRRGRFHWLSST